MGGPRSSLSNNFEFADAVTKGVMAMLIMIRVGMRLTNQIKPAVATEIKEESTCSF